MHGYFIDKRARRREAVGAGAALLVAVLGGCGAKTHVVPFSQAEKNLGLVAAAYTDAFSRLGHSPKNADELKPFLKTLGNADELLVSPNDGQPFVVVWGVPDPTRGGPTPYKGMFPILAYERAGKHGMRAVTDIRGRPMLVPEADFPKLTFVAGHKPAGPGAGGSS
jgi:hypothetical protein